MFTRTFWIAVMVFVWSLPALLVFVEPAPAIPACSSLCRMRHEFYGCIGGMCSVFTYDTCEFCYGTTGSCLPLASDSTTNTWFACQTPLTGPATSDIQRYNSCVASCLCNPGVYTVDATTFSGTADSINLAIKVCRL